MRLLLMYESSRPKDEAVANPSLLPDTDYNLQAKYNATFGHYPVDDIEMLFSNKFVVC